MDVQMPDGTIITGVPDDITQASLLERYSNYQPQQAGLASLQSTLPPTSNPLFGLISRTGSLIGEGIEGVARVAEKVGDKLEGVIPLSGLTAEQITKERQLEPLFRFAESTKNWARGINYEPSTKLSDLASNPLNAIPFIAERVISSSPDMLASVVAMPAYVSARTNEILNERLKNDEKSLEDATVADVTSALGGAVLEATLERGATKRLFKGQPIAGKTGTTRALKETGYQSGTEAIEEGIGYLAGTVGTKKGVDTQELLENMAEGAIVGGGLGGTVRGTKEYLDYRNKKKEAADAIIKEEEGVIPPIEEVVQPVPEQPTQEVFYSEEPLPQEILDQGYKLVGQTEEDGKVYYSYTKEEPVAETVAEPVAEIAAPEAAPVAPELPLGAAPESAEQRALPPVAQPAQPEIVQPELVEQPIAEPVSAEPAQPAQIAQPEIVQPVDPNVEARLAVEPVEPVAPSEPPPVAPKKVAKAAAPKAGEKILSAHEFIASLGGLNKKEAVEINPDAAKANVRIGNKWLYASKGGLSASEAAEKLAEAGYIQTEDNNEVYRVINDSLIDPVYSINDADAIAERRFAEQAAEEADRFAKKEAEAGVEAQEISAEARAEQGELQTEESLRQYMLDSGYTEQDLNVVGFTKASPELKAEVVELEQQMKALGIDPSSIVADISFESKTDLEYYNRAKSEFAKAITQAAKQGSRGDVSQANVPTPPAELTSPSQEELKAKQEAADKAAADKARADREAEAKDKVDAERKEIAARSEKAAAEFELGKTAEEDLTGQKDLLAIAKKADIPPVLQKPTDFVLKEGRIEQVVLAARALAEGKITKAEYDAYIDAYAPIATVPNPEQPLGVDGMKRVLKSNQVGKINPDIKDGTRVGIRMDINALKRARELSEKTGEKVSGSVVSIHEGSDINTQGKIIGYSAAASIKNARFAIRNEQKAFKVAQGIEDKSPQQTIEGEWVNISPEDAYARVKSLLKDPKWAQVSLDPLRHSFFYDRSNKRPVVSADEILQVGRFVLAKNVKYAERDQFLYSQGTIKAPTQKDIENANIVANATGSNVVYQDGELGLFMKLSPINGEPLYFAAKGAKILNTGNGVQLLDSVPANNQIFTAAELDSLKQARDRIEDAEYAKFAANNPIKIKDGVGFSASISPKLQGLLSDWKNLLKLDQNIYLATNKDVLDNSDQYAGPLRRIVAAANKKFSGITQQLEDGSRYILVNENLSEDHLIETLAHELGHIHEKAAYDKASPEMKAKLQDEFKRWLDSAKIKNSRDFIDSLRSKEVAKDTNIPDPLAPAKNSNNFYTYWATFSEWYADQTARWATTAEKPRSSVEKFFAKVAETLRNFFSFAKNKGFLPNETFAQYMDAITAPDAVQNHIIAPEKKIEQLPLFSIGKLTQAPTVPSTGTPRMNILGAPIAGTWSAAPETTLTPWIYKFQDKQVDLKDAQKQIEKTVGKIDDALNAYRKETLYYGRVADQTERFLTEELKPLLKDMMDKKLTLDEVDKYLQALHAEERNKSIAKRINGMPDGGAGISTADAQAYLAGLSPDKARDLKDISDRVRKIIAGTQAIEVNGGLELQSKIDGWNKAWPNYVPLFRDEVDYVNSGSGMGQGFSVRGSSSKRAVGSDKPVKEIIASLAEQRQKAIVRTEKARVGKALYALAIANPNPDYWLAIDPNSKEDIKKVEQMLQDYGFDPGDIAQLIQNMAQEPRTGTVKRVFNPVTKQFDEVVKYDINTQNRYSSNVLPVRINGEDKFLFFNPSNARAKRMAESVKNLDAEQLGEVTQTIGNVTRFIAAMSTQYNPIFGAWNFARDVQGAALNLSTTPLKDKKAEVVAGAFKAMKGIYAELRARRAGKQASGHYSDLYREFESEGGKTGFINQFNNLNKKGTIVERELKGLTQGRVKGAVSALGNWLSDYNDMLENAVRLSAYEQAHVVMKLSKEEAAEIAKNLTVNFNRKGAKTAGLGALYAFFNSSVQGTARLYETLRGPAGKKIIAGGFLLGAFQAALLAMAGFDEDEPSEFIKQKNFVIPTLDGGYIMVPMPLGFNILPNVGRIISEIAFGNKKSASRKVGDLMEAVVSSFNPLGGGNMVQMAMPTVLDPIANVIINRDSFGRPISREDRAMNPSPGYLRSRESAGVVAKGIAEFLNYVSGGTEFNKGAFSPTGDDINYIVGQYLGGVGREVMRAKEFVASIGKEEPFEPYKVPILGKVYGDINAPASVANKFYLNVKQMAEHENEIKGRKGSAISEYMRENPDARLYRTANRLENDISKLNKTKKQLLEKDAPEAAIRRIEDQKLRMMKQFNDQVRKLQ